MSIWAIRHPTWALGLSRRTELYYSINFLHIDNVCHMEIPGRRGDTFSYISLVFHLSPKVMGSSDHHLSSGLLSNNESTPLPVYNTNAKCLTSQNISSRFAKTPEQESPSSHGQCRYTRHNSACYRPVVICLDLYAKYPLNRLNHFRCFIWCWEYICVYLLDKLHGSFVWYIYCLCLVRKYVLKEYFGSLSATCRSVHI